jgi:DNA-binding transcriptional MerR regulator
MPSRNTSPNADRWLGPGELAREAKTSIKALRVYEKAGLLAPDRREGGWRLYGPRHVARLHQILALKALGLSLKQIGEMIAGDGLAIDRIMDFQARQLATTIRSARNRLKRVQHARDQLASGGQLSAALLLELARDLSPPAMIDIREVRAAIEGAIQDTTEQAAISAIVNKPAERVTENDVVALLEEAAIAAAAADPESSNARTLAARWLALAADLDLPVAETEEDVALRRVVARVIADPALAEPLTFLREAVMRRTAPAHKKG